MLTMHIRKEDEKSLYTIIYDDVKKDFKRNNKKVPEVIIKGMAYLEFLNIKNKKSDLFAFYLYSENNELIAVAPFKIDLNESEVIRLGIMVRPGYEQHFISYDDMNVTPEEYIDLYFERRGSVQKTNSFIVYTRKSNQKRIDLLEHLDYELDSVQKNSYIYSKQR